MAVAPYRRIRHLLLLMRLFWDFVKGMYVFHPVGPCVTVFGSARLNAQTPAYQAAHRVGRALSGLGLTVMTGGGPGLMEAVTRGAREVGGRSAACGVRFSFEQAAGGHADWRVTVRYLFVRKVMLCRYSCAFVVLPGGFGTLDELFEVLTLVQTKKIAPVPIALVGVAYWQPLMHVLDHMVAAGTVSPADLQQIRVTDDTDEVVEHIKTHVTEAFHLHRRTPPWAMPHASSVRDV